MIARLQGHLIEKQPPVLVVDVHGVGYELEAPMSTFYKVTLGAPVTLFTHQVVREDAHLLYGFATRDERDLFRTLLKVNGVGPKLALAILSGMEADAFAACVRQGDVATLVRIPGVGKKTAERLVMELRDRVGNGPAGLSTFAITAGLRFPPLYSMRDSRASGLPWNQPVPYSSRYRSPLGENSMSIGLLNFVLGMNRSMETMSPFASMVMAMIQPRIHS